MSYSDNYMCQTGLKTPDGNPFGNIMFNGDMHQEAENVMMNQNTYWMYLWRLMDLSISVFDWQNLPDGVDPRMLEFWLMRNGFCVFFYDEMLKDSSLADGNAPEGYAVLQALINGPWDMYNYPTQRRAYSVNGLNIDLNETNSVLIFNDYLRVPIYPTLQLYAQRLAEIDRTIDINVMNQKTPKIVRCDEKQRLTFKNLMMQAQGNVYWIFGDKNIDLRNIDVLDVTAPYVANELQILKHQYWNEALTFLGVENVTTEKKERLISNEVMSNMGDVEAQRFTRLNARKYACQQINDLFGLDVNCEFRSGIYIKADGYGAQNIASQGMQSGDLPVDAGGYQDEASGIISKLKQILGM
ncbi:MAG: hypothetical protein IKE94_01180 [Aeriscardovia sp.]|nr:hypothetical protein [Aeriscardovia sp.]